MKVLGNMSKALIGGCVVFLIIFTLVNQAAAQTCTLAPSGLIGWWDGDAVAGTTAFDIQGANNGTLTNGATTAAGFVGNAFSFDGVNDFIQLPFDSGIFTNQYTIDAWAFPTKEVDLSFLQGIFDNDVSGNRGVSLAVFETTPLNVAGFTHNSSGTQSAVQNVPSAANQWNHYALTYDGSELCLFQNGVNEGCAAASGTVRDNNVNFRIGDGQFDGDMRRFYGGLIDEVEIYNRALSGPEEGNDCTDEPDTEICKIFLANISGKCKVEFDWDAKFCSNPNAFNCKRTRGSVPVTIFGSADLDVTDIDISSLRLALDSDPSMMTGAPISSKPPADRGSPGDVNITVCSGDIATTDGEDDLDVGFDAGEVGILIGCDANGGLSKGDDSPALIITGTLNDGTSLGALNTQVLTNVRK